MSKEEILEKLNQIYQEMKSLYNIKELKLYYYGELCFYLGMEYIEKSIRLIQGEENEQL